MRRATQAFVVLFLLLLAVPKLQRVCHLFPLISLGGVEQRQVQPAFTLRAWWNGTFQPVYEAYFNARFALRAHAVLTWNQLNFSLFHQLPPRKGTQVVVGNDHWLYEQDYIRAYNRPRQTPVAELQAIVGCLRRLQDKLAVRGIGCLLVLAPSKVEIYPEHVPNRMLWPGRENRRSDYERIRPLLKQAGVHVIDAGQMFRELKAVSPYPLFPKTGTHWNYYSAGLVAGRIVENLEAQLDRDFVNLRIAGATVDDVPFGTDNDLGELLNVWGTLQFWGGATYAGTQVHPIYERLAASGSEQPNLLFIGDSFAFTLTEIMDQQHLCRKRETLYYFKRRYHYPVANPRQIARFEYQEASSEPFDPEHVDVLAELVGRDAVIIEINEYWLPNIGFGFVERALTALSGEAGRP